MLQRVNDVRDKYQGHSDKMKKERSEEQSRDKINAPTSNGLAGASSSRMNDASKEPASISLTAEALNEIASKVALQLAPLLGELAADIVAATDKWFIALHSRLEESNVLSKAAGNADPTVAEKQIAAARSLKVLNDASRESITKLKQSVVGLAEPKASIDADKKNASVTAVQKTLLPAASMPPVASVSLARFRFLDGWHDWIGYKGVRLGQAGCVEILDKDGTPGVVSPLLRLSESGLHRVTVVFGAESVAGGLRLRVTDLHDEWVGPELILNKKVNWADFFVPRRIRAVKIFVLSHAARMGLNIQLVEVSLDRVDVESYFQQRRAEIAQPVIASMASIPSRREMMRDAVESLIVQCDLVRVFLNEYADVPDFLDHPRIQIKRSQDYDDKGDAGKFGWIDDGDDPGFRVIVDDDLLFPPDFVRHMTSVLKEYGNYAIGGLHGILLKQPITKYYEPSSRTSFHFESTMKADRTVHVLGTNAVVYHSSCVHLRWDDFMFRNMADIFLARHAQEKQLPMIAVNRPWRWVRQNKQDKPFETIYANSLKRSRSKFDSSLLQDNVVKSIAPLTIQPTMRSKMALCLLGTDCTLLKDSLASWVATHVADVDWVVLVAAATNDEIVRQYVADLRCPFEIHVFSDKESSPAERVVEMFMLAAHLDAAMICVAVDSISFESGGWAKGALGLMRPHRPIVVYLEENGDKLVVGRSYSADRLLPKVTLFDSRLLVPGAISSFTPLSPAQVLSRVFVASAETADVISSDVSAASSIVASFRHRESPQTHQALAQHSSGRRYERSVPSNNGGRGLNRFIEKVVVINLDRRPDRWSQMKEGLDKVGVSAERFRAIDGKWEEVAEEYRSYCSVPLAAVGPPIRNIKSSREYYFDYDSQRARVAYVEQRTKKKAIASVGAWAYLRTWEKILEQALHDEVSSVLIFDDDVVFRKEFQEMFAAATEELPEDWLILQLGTLQYHWEGEWMMPVGKHLYKTNGSAVGSHAVALRRDVIPFLLDHIKRMELPLDTGALAAATRAFKDQCFVITPNLAIQRLGDSDINSSDFQQSRKRDESFKIYRWTESDYYF